MMQGNSEWPTDPAQIPATAQERRADRVRSWRRRVLLRRGARLHAALTLQAKDCSLAMLDETGIVVSWHGQLGAGRGASDDIVNRHVSQFYIPEEIASNQPHRDLRAATIEGSNTRQGWRRQPDGTTFWGTILIEAVVLRDGRLQGFSYVTGACDGRSADVPVPQSLSFGQGEETGDLDQEVSPLRFRLQRDRMVRSRYAARLRRLSRLAPALLVLALCTSLPVAAEPSALPDHARASRYGSGWDCVSGFRRAGNTCVRIVVPTNAYLDAAGSGWRCNRGFLSVREGCVAVKVPQNAYLDDSYGQGWRCELGYREASDACVTVQIPMNAHASGSSYGSGWECNRAFRQAGAACLAVVVPAQGYLTRSGTTGSASGVSCEKILHASPCNLRPMLISTIRAPAGVATKAFISTPPPAWRIDAPARAHGRVSPPLAIEVTCVAVCNRHHSPDEQLCRWLLLSLDRLSGNKLVMTQELIANMLGVRRADSAAACAAPVPLWL